MVLHYIGWGSREATLVNGRLQVAWLVRFGFFSAHFDGDCRLIRDPGKKVNFATDGLSKRLYDASTA